MAGTEWKRLADRLVSRRVELGMTTAKSFADKADLTTRVIGDLENARRTNYGAGTKAQIENALRWGPGSVDAILAGGEPTDRERLGSALAQQIRGTQARAHAVPPPSNWPHDLPDKVRGMHRSTGDAVRAAELGDESELVVAITVAAVLASDIMRGLGRVPNQAQEEETNVHMEATSQPGASRKAQQVQEGQTADELAKRRPPPADLDDTPPPIEFADAARNEPGHVKTGDRVQHVDTDTERGETSE